MEEEPINGSTPSALSRMQPNISTLPHSQFFDQQHSLILGLVLKMRLLASIIVFAATISALPITDTNTPPAAEITTPNTADVVDTNVVTANIAATESTKDGPWGYGPPNGGYNYNYNYNNGPGGYGGGYGSPPGPPPRSREPEGLGGLLGSVGYGVGTIIGTPVGLLGDIVGGATHGLYNGIRGSYRRKG
ncbi:hypothetical protein Vi05172_g5385 [Venturia inaequalis]|uniref:Uncharacterized protein n=2 Tax=Venturia inaequalis TaxID=5025 RepID=A0A8H3V331_VENIN|nr:hypothetical protein EG327_006879 [Venturia inaequalis]RDI84561.1 hypothetical protein Vi05172_g5385 [Venturia inaequalis]